MTMKAVLFDLDGTLVESKSIWYNLLNSCRKHYGYDELIYNEWEPTFGQSMEMNKKLFFPKQTQQQVNEYCDLHYSDYVKKLTILDGTPNTLEYCYDKYNHNVVCVTNCPRAILNVIFNKTDFKHYTHYFKHVVCAGDTVDYIPKHGSAENNNNSIDGPDKHDISMSVHIHDNSNGNGTTHHNSHQDNNNNNNRSYKLQPKKSPDTLLHACKLLDIQPTEAYFVGDTSHDMEAANTAGCTGIGINVDGGKHKINSISQLTNVI